MKFGRNQNYEINTRNKNTEELPSPPPQENPGSATVSEDNSIQAGVPNI